MLASEVCIEDLMMQARKIKYDVIGLTETRRYRSLLAVFETGRTVSWNMRQQSGIGVLVNRRHLVVNIDSYESSTTRIGHPVRKKLRLKSTAEEPFHRRLLSATVHHPRFADDILFITPNIEQAERMLTEFGNGKIGLRLSLTKTMFMRNGSVPSAPFTQNGKNIPVCSSYLYLCSEVNMMNDLAPELCRRKRVVWGTFKNIERVVKKKNIRLRAHLLDAAFLPLTYASETWTLRTQDEHAVSVTQRALERTMLRIPL
uniref:Reverse transcriptase domain-containing protein n=1 Tax=Haemonchus contortus TaxID=6289 RepID=A0A7I4XSJ4_HAECO